jgi:hypothetical protein
MAQRFDDLIKRGIGVFLDVGGLQPRFGVVIAFWPSGRTGEYLLT